MLAQALSISYQGQVDRTYRLRRFSARDRPRFARVSSDCRSGHGLNTQTWSVPPVPQCPSAASYNPSFPTISCSDPPRQSLRAWSWWPTVRDADTSGRVCTFFQMILSAWLARSVRFALSVSIAICLASSSTCGMDSWGVVALGTGAVDLLDPAERILGPDPRERDNLELVAPQKRIQTCRPGWWRCRAGRPLPFS